MSFPKFLKLHVRCQFRFHIFKEVQKRQMSKGSDFRRCLKTFINFLIRNKSDDFEFFCCVAHKNFKWNEKFIARSISFSTFCAELRFVAESLLITKYIWHICCEVSFDELITHKHIFVVNLSQKIRKKKIRERVGEACLIKLTFMADDLS